MKDLFGFDPVAAKNAKLEAMTRVNDNANTSWKNLMLSLVTKTARQMPSFTTDDVFERFWSLPEETRPETHDRRALGPVMLKAAKLGICRKSDGPWVPTARASRHAAPLQVWKSLIYEVKRSDT